MFSWQFTLNTLHTLSLSIKNLFLYFKLFENIFSNPWSYKPYKQWYEIEFLTTETLL